MATPITSGSFAKALWPGVMDFWQADKAHDVEYTKLFKVMSSKQQFEEMVNLSALGLHSTRDEGNATTYDSMEQAYISRFRHTVYSNGFVVTRVMYEDNLYGGTLSRLLNDNSAALKASSRETKEHIGANVLNRGFNSSYTMGSDHDGVELFSTAHPRGPKGGTYANMTTAADLSETSLESMLITIDQAVNERGFKIAVKPKMLIVPPDLRFEASRIINSTLQNDTSNNAINVLNHESALPEGYTVNHYLTDSDAWFVKTDQPKGLIWFDRWADRLTNDNDFDTDNMKVKCVFRVSAGWVDPRGMYGNAGA